jgi:dTDP-4-amino-4,6-dideoxygalactose transaminase
LKEKIWLSSSHMSDEGYEKEFIKEAFDTGWITHLETIVNAFEIELAPKVREKAPKMVTTYYSANSIANAVKDSKYPSYEYRRGGRTDQ